ncbi:hypothetical protein GPECTOR_33g644 [Gonium pectorale]|uniref:EF-hand domain-containing protein n=1 Tax=Gonium pectorale TaxID=33097 RepID=A0A150GD50_GONPE|nr:hypothetical protein GPECTOR_33g644 [Gonium pectorale]|eukprot:KXZ47762.1 hypothetical protein GPECTOR_33g644 [Gonium pectorale]
MGNQQGRTLGGRLTKKDIERLQRRFQRLANSNGKVNIAVFESMVELGGNPFVGRIFKLFDESGDGCLNMEEFTRALEYFGQLDAEDEQYRFAFRVYDSDKDGLISSEELFAVLQALLGSTYPDAQLEQVVYNTMSEFDRDGDNKLNFEEFKMLLSRQDLANKFSVNL